jgi:CHAT domain-containing protein
VQLMVLPTAPDGLPQVLFEDGGIWRETTPPLPGALTQSALRHSIEAHLAEIMGQVGGDPPVQVPASRVGFLSRFGECYRNLLPREVCEVLTAASRPGNPGAAPPLLKIYATSPFEWIPWELLHDGTTFLGLRFCVCRMPIVRQRTEVRGPSDRPVQSVFSLLARDILPQPVQQAWATTFQPYARAAQWEHRYPNGAAVGYPTLDQLVEAKNADVIHLTCHGGLRDGTDIYWTLDHRNPQFYDYRITTSIAESTRWDHRPLVFGNACASNATPANDLGILHGFGASFMIAGALNFVGTFAPITRDTAVTFATRFYEQLFGTGGAAGLPVADALLATKQGFFQANHPDPSYLFYCLYGPPDTTYRPA